MQPADQIQQPCPILQILSVRTEMDPGQDYLLTSGGQKTPHLLLHIFHPPAPHPAPGVGDDAVAAELVAAILNLDKSTGMSGHSADIQILIFPGSVNRDHLRPDRLFHRPAVVLPLHLSGRIRLWSPISLPGQPAFIPLPEKVLQHRHQILLFVIPYDNIYSQILGKGLLCCLDIASRRHDHRLGIHLPGSVKHLAGFAFRNIGDGTGIDYIDICHLLKGHDLIACGLQQLLHGLRLIGIS